MMLSRGIWWGSSARLALSGRCPRGSSTRRRPLHRDRTAPKSLALFVDGDETHDLRFALHLSDDLADLVLRQLGLGQTDAIELATHIQRSLDHGGLVGAQEIRDVGRGRLRRKAYDCKRAVAGRARKAGPGRYALLLDHDAGDHRGLHQNCSRS